MIHLRLKFLCLLTAVLFASGCSQQTCRLTGLTVTPPSATADHVAAPPGNQVQFFANAVISGGCYTPACVNCSGQTWTVSDTVNVSISNNPGTNGTATCLGTTNGAVTVTATAPVGTTSKTVAATATLTCK